LLAVAHGFGDTNPIPNPLPNSFAFDPPLHDQIAQRNISVLLAAKMSAPLSIAVNALSRTAKRVQVTVAYGGMLDERVLEQLGLKKLRPAKERVVDVRLSREPRCDIQHSQGDDKDNAGNRELTVEVGRGKSVPVYVNMHARDLSRGDYQLVHILERHGETVLGGVSYIIINPHEEQAT